MQYSNGHCRIFRKKKLRSEFMPSLLRIPFWISVIHFKSSITRISESTSALPQNLHKFQKVVMSCLQSAGKKRSRTKGSAFFPPAQTGYFFCFFCLIFFLTHSTYLLLRGCSWASGTRCTSADLIGVSYVPSSSSSTSSLS